jgi:hypothetical protein
MEGLKRCFFPALISKGSQAIKFVFFVATRAVYTLQLWLITRQSCKLDKKVIDRLIWHGFFVSYRRTICQSLFMK